MAEIPESTLVHRTVACPWSLKGTVMRAATEHLLRSADEDDLSLLDGIQVRRDAGWVQLLPDADEPVFHVYAEGEDREASEALAAEVLTLVREVLDSEG